MWTANKLRQSNSGAILLLGALCLLTYWPAFDNGFISDDFIILDRVDTLTHNYGFLFSVPPECFRISSYIFFGLLKFVFGYHAEWFYVFNLLLHLANSFLLWKLISRITRSNSVGFLAACFFAVIQGHQEAIMWLAAMNETLMGFFLLLCMLWWHSGRPGWSVLPYLAGLFSKESALIFLGLVPWLELHTHRRLRWRAGFLPVLLVSAAFCILFTFLLTQNFMVSTGTYKLGFHAVTVFLLSMHRLLFPWVYLAIIIHFAGHGTPKHIKDASWGLGFAAIGLLPYIFLTYQNHVTSRQEYLASIGIVWFLAVLIHACDKRFLRRSFIVAFIIVNAGYIWLRKDAQFENRAAPTGKLMEVLRTCEPQNLVIQGFPGNPWIARNTGQMVPGWNRNLIHADEPAPKDHQWLTLKWDPKKNSYLIKEVGLE